MRNDHDNSNNGGLTRREVLRRLGQSETATPVAGTANGTRRVPATLVWPGRLVTWKDLESQIDGVQILQLQPRTVVTPEARDWLKRRGVRIEVR